jgi:hypothetical protein
VTRRGGYLPGCYRGSNASPWEPWRL